MTQCSGAPQCVGVFNDSIPTLTVHRLSSLPTVHRLSIEQRLLLCPLVAERQLTSDAPPEAFLISWILLYHRTPLAFLSLSLSLSPYDCHLLWTGPSCFSMWACRGLQSEAPSITEPRPPGLDALSWGLDFSDPGPCPGLLHLISPLTAPICLPRLRTQKKAYKPYTLSIHLPACLTPSLPLHVSAPRSAACLLRCY